MQRRLAEIWRRRNEKVGGEKEKRVGQREEREKKNFKRREEERERYKIVFFF